MSRLLLLGVGRPGSGHVASPDYGNTGGTGDRTGIITVTWDGTTGGGTVSDLVDGSQSNEFWWNAGQTNKILKFDFGVGASKVINEFKWYQDNAVGHGSAQTMAGSNDDSNWTNFPDAIAIGSSATTTVTITNTTGYRYYRLSIPGATSASPFLREIEFKIDDA